MRSISPSFVCDMFAHQSKWLNIKDVWTVRGDPGVPDSHGGCYKGIDNRVGFVTKEIVGSKNAQLWKAFAEERVSQRWVVIILPKETLNFK